MKDIEDNFRAKYPVVWDFLETTLWPDVDGFNPIALLHRIVYHGHPERSLRLIEELNSLSQDEDIDSTEISRLFNREEVGHPYQVVTPENAKDFCFSMQESLAFVQSLRGAQ